MKKYWQMFRRRFYIMFRKKYILDSLAKRKGKCNRCTCCELWAFGKKYDCNHYGKKRKECFAYNACNMPATCFYYPFDEKDKWDEFRSGCGFYWE